MQYSIKTYTKTAQTGVKICASAMIAVSATAMFLAWGMMSAVSISSVTKMEPDATTFSCPKKPYQYFNMNTQEVLDKNKKNENDQA